MWQAWILAKTLKCRPSEVYHIHEEFTAYCFDNAVTTWGLTVEQAVKEKTEKAKNQNSAKRQAQQVMDKYLNSDGQTKGRFRDPMATR